MSKPSEELLARAKEFMDTRVSTLSPTWLQDAMAQFAEQIVRECAGLMDTLAENWMNSLPIDQVQALNCRQYKKAILRKFGLKE